MTTKNVTELTALAKQNGLELSDSNLQLNESGLDFAAAFARTTDGTAWVLRMPRRADVVESAVYEKRILDLVRTHLPVSVPDWKIHTPEIIAYPMLEGTPAATINPETQSYDWYLDQQAIPECFKMTLAETLVALHTVDHTAAGNAGLRVLEPADVRQRMADRMNDVKRIFGVSRALWDRWQTWLADDSYWPKHSALVHSDLHPGHILVSPEGIVTGLLDWTEAEAADPAIDFVTYYALFGDSGLAELLAYYERAGGKVWQRMNAHIAELWAAYPVLIAMFALKSGLEEYMVMARHTLGVDEHGQELEPDYPDSH